MEQHSVFEQLNNQLKTKLTSPIYNFDKQENESLDKSCLYGTTQNFIASERGLSFFVSCPSVSSPVDRIWLAASVASYVHRRSHQWPVYFVLS